MKAKCNFQMAWTHCEQEPLSTGMCLEHSVTKCSICGELAIKQCSNTGQLVCGYPLCSRRECLYKHVEQHEGFWTGHGKPICFDCKKPISIPRKVELLLCKLDYASLCYFSILQGNNLGSKPSKVAGKTYDQLNDELE